MYFGIKKPTFTATQVSDEDNKHVQSLHFQVVLLFSLEILFLSYQRISITSNL